MIKSSLVQWWMGLSSVPEDFGYTRIKKCRRCFGHWQKQGLAVLTDSDTAGFKIRGFLRSICGKENIVDVYIPDLYGKEKRKDHPSKEGKLGVEGVPEEVLQKAFADAGIGAELVLQKKDPITKMDLFELGLSGRAESALRRKQLMKHLTLPEHRCHGRFHAELRDRFR